MWCSLLTLYPQRVLDSAYQEVVKHVEGIPPQYFSSRCDLVVLPHLNYRIIPLPSVHFFFIANSQLLPLMKCWERGRVTDVIYHNILAAFMCKASVKVWSPLSQGNSDAFLIISFSIHHSLSHLYLQGVCRHVEPCENDGWRCHSLDLLCAGLCCCCFYHFQTYRHSTIISLFTGENK